MLTLQDPTGNIVLTREDNEHEGPRVALSLDGARTPLRRLGVHHWDAGALYLEDIQVGVERTLELREGGIWHLGDTPLLPAEGLDLASAPVAELPHCELDFLLKEGGQLIALVRTQGQLKAWGLQAYVGTNTAASVRLIQRGKPALVEKDDTVIHVSVGVDDVCRLKLSPTAERCSALRGSGRLMHGNLTGSRPLTALDPSAYTWGEDEEYANAITLQYTRMMA